MSFEEPSFLTPKRTAPRGEFRPDWLAAILGAAATIAGFAIFGTLIGNLTAQYLVRQGVPVDQARIYLADHWVSIPGILGMLANFVCGLFGGWVAARGRTTASWLQGLLTCLVVSVFTVVTYLSPDTITPNSWQLVLMFVLPCASIMLGAMLHARRA